MKLGFVVFVLCAALLAPSASLAEVETITAKDLQTLQKKLDKQKDTAGIKKPEKPELSGPIAGKAQPTKDAGESNAPFSGENVYEARAFIVDYLSFIAAVYKKTKTLPTSDNDLKKATPEDFEEFWMYLSKTKESVSPQHFGFSYNKSQLSVSYKGKPLLIFSTAKVRSEGIDWRCKVATKTLSLKIDEDDNLAPPTLVNFDGEDCRKKAVFVPAHAPDKVFF